MEYKCVHCQKTQILSDKERAFYDMKGFSYPKRCKPCREFRKEHIAKYESRAYEKQSWQR